MATILDMAEQQIYGWHSAKQGETLLILVNAMGLTSDEWKILKDDGVVNYLTSEQCTEIDEYFDNQYNEIG